MCHRPSKMRLQRVLVWLLSTSGLTVFV
ncbi:hypothetical protein SVAN01_10266 [Stagonosporopsis vannaccii]|nr:hypothetical protein SVAN01_10266 [Stagonosporopsis vannaccii]